MKYKKQCGYILIVILLFLQVSIILGLYIVQTSLLAQKMGHAQWRRNEALFEAEKVLQKLEGELIEGRYIKCFLPQISSHSLLEKTLDWWQTSVSCPGILDNNYKYYYVVETLGEDSCADVECHRVGSVLDAAAYYFRVTLLIIDIHNNTREMLQSTIIKLDNALHECTGKHHRVALGIQTWHTL